MRAFDLAQWLATELNNLPIQPTLRNRLSGACLSIAQDHHLAVATLIENDLCSSALAMVRPTYEAYVRGLWLTHCAEERELSRFSLGEEPPKMSTLIEQVETLPAFSDGRLSDIKAQSWSAMCAYTHTGSLQAQRWNTKAAIEQNYSQEELAEALNFSGSIALLSALEIANIASDDVLASKILDRSRSFARHDP